MDDSSRSQRNTLQLEIDLLELEINRIDSKIVRLTAARIKMPQLTAADEYSTDEEINLLLHLQNKLLQVQKQLLRQLLEITRTESLRIQAELDRARAEYERLQRELEVLKLKSKQNDLQIAPFKEKKSCTFPSVHAILFIFDLKKPFQEDISQSTQIRIVKFFYFDLSVDSNSNIKIWFLF